MQDGHVCILGMGYVGLTLAVVMAEKGFTVSGLEINPHILEALQSGKAHFFEAGLEVRLKRILTTGRLKFSRTCAEAGWTKAPTTFIITVGTPLGQDGVPRMDMVESVAREVAQNMSEDAMIVLRSTVKLGTSRRVVLPLLQATGKKFRLAYCPERTIEGKALEELSYLPQVVGGLTEADALRAAQLFQHVTPTTIRVSSLEAAEIIKLLDNSYRDLFFALGNEVALLCDAAGLDGIEVIRAANMGYERTNLALPGFVGGPCLQKDPHILAHSLAGFGYVPKMITTARALNEALPQHVIEQIMVDLPKSGIPAGGAITVCGLAFKGRPETDDLRGTPAYELIDALEKAFPHAKLRGQDYAVAPQAIKGMGLEPVDIEGAFKDASLVIVANNNSKYQWVNLDGLVATMKKPAIVYDAWSVLPFDKTTEAQGVTFRRLGSARAWRGGN